MDDVVPVSSPEAGDVAALRDPGAGENGTPESVTADVKTAPSPQRDAGSSARPSAAAPHPAGTLAAFSATMSADVMIPVAAAKPSHFAVVHPQGFRILNNASAMERSMRGYFRLPQPPSTAAKAEQRRLQRTLREVEREEAQRRAQITGSGDGVVLDGFLILSACEADDPQEVTALTLQASHLTNSVHEDLQYFTELTALDVSDNQLGLGDVLPFPKLESVHLVCNSISSLADAQWSDSASLASLTSLDLAFNRIPARDLLRLGAFSALQHLDLSHNGLRTLPADLSSLSRLTHLALEGNHLTAADVFYALATMPALEEANLAHNQLSQVPQLQAAPWATGGGVDFFPALRRLTLTDNRFHEAEGLLPLVALHRTLRYVAVGGNPLLSRRSATAARELQLAFDEGVVDAFFAAQEPPVTAAPDTTSEALSGTWRGQTWVRYLPPPQRRDDDDGAEAAAAALPCSATAAAAEEGGGDGPTGRPHESLREELLSSEIRDSRGTQRTSGGAQTFTVSDLTAEQYVERYRVTVQCATQPPPPPKQSKRFFYSSAYRATLPDEQGVPPLVTLPPHEEFMDMYRIAGRRRAAKHSQQTQLSTSRPRPANTHAVRSPALPVLSRPPPPAAPEPSAQAAGESAGEEEEETDEKVEEDVAAAHGEDDGFFLTGMHSEAPRTKPRGRAAARRERRGETGGEPHSPHEAVLPAEEAAEQQADGAALGGPPLRSPLPRSVVAPANANVHAAMSELRAMLRKPLPSLPYESTRARQGR